MSTNNRIHQLVVILCLVGLASIIFNNYSEEILNFKFHKLFSSSRKFDYVIEEYNGTKYYHQKTKVNRDFFLKPPKEFPTTEQETNQFRSGEIKKAFLHAWSSYKKHAWGRDNVAPLSQRPTNGWQGWGITLVDSLDILLLMGLRDEYQEALKEVEKIDFTTAKTPVMVFETIIRYLGGLLGAYDLQPNPMLLTQAQILADKLLPAFDTPSGLPAHKLNFRTGVIQGMGGTNNDQVNLAEIGSLQLEFHRLSQLTQNSTYSKVAQRIIDGMEKMKTKTKGLYPLLIDKSDISSMTESVSFGAMGDSFYEYLLKRYLLTNQTEEQYRRMYETSIDSLHDYLLEQRGSEFDHMMLLTETSVSGQVVYKMDHLTCFVPGMLGLGGLILNRTRDLLVSQELVYSCRHLYKMTTTGLGPESVEWTPTSEEVRSRTSRTGMTPSYRPPESIISSTPYKDGFKIKDPRYLLRPETLESIFYSYRLTGDPMYQDWAWEIFQAIQTHCLVEGGYAEYADVRAVPGFMTPNLHVDSMESFFLAETLKYLYLIFMPPDHLNLNDYVLTTEAHPLRITHP